MAAAPEAAPETQYIYLNSLTSAQSQPTSLRALVTLLSSASANPRIVSSQTPVFSVSGSSNEWQSVASIPTLNAASASFYYLDSTTNQASPDLIRPSDLARKMDEGAVDGMTMVCSNTYPKLEEGSTAHWSSISNLPELRVVLQMLSSSEEGGDVGAEVSEKDMVFEDDEGKGGEKKGEEDELASFLKDTEKMGGAEEQGAVDKNGTAEEEEDDSYESDGGTTYVKEPLSGVFVDENDLPPQVRALRRKKLAAREKKEKALASKNQPVPPKNPQQKRKRNKKAHNWIYVTGLPLDATEDEVISHFSKAGILEISPETLRPQVKLYKDGEGKLKGDGSICYANEESVDLALRVFDGSTLRFGDKPLTVTKAAFEKKAGGNKKKKPMDAKAVAAKRKVAQLMAAQAMGWDEGENGRIAGGAKGLTIVVLENMYTKSELKKDEDATLKSVENAVISAVSAFNGTIEKVTVFSKSENSVLIIKFKEVEAANTCVREMNGFKNWRNNVDLTIKAHFWDGVTDYTNVTEEEVKEEENKRLDDFGDWIDNQEVPEEFQERSE
ncbi:hypothetical protein TrLO_g3558 [Triparma laevis f. longispina]|uniref:RRM domain-containing protein n=1 Tax=Triparma laevis f. longispina TaxID=1714387 RepID=A0A9W6ZGY4_9STRA|nr:hypothetical protein TrLO_g3558 [Triparma laevis f. longispina]